MDLTCHFGAGVLHKGAFREIGSIGMTGQFQGQGVTFDRERFAEVRRLAVYSVLNGGLVFFGEMQRRFALRPADAQICLIIHTGSIQKVVRNPNVSEEHMAGIPLTLDELSGISRRQIATLTGLSRQAVGSSVAMLLERGLIVEKSAGKLVAPPGFLNDVEGMFPTGEMVAPLVSVFETFARLGIIRVRE